MSTTASADAMLSAIERSGYYPGLVADAVSAAVGPEQVVSFFVHHDTHFDPSLEVRRHMTVLALTPTRLVYSHTDEYPADESVPEPRPQAEASTQSVPEPRPQAETSTEAIRCSRISSVALTKVIPDPAKYVPGVTMPSEIVLTIGWNSLRHLELEPAHCGDENCDADHGYTGAITSDDVTMRISEAVDGAEAVTQVLEFARALAAATSAP